MAKPPLILVSPGIEKSGFEFGDLSISLSVRYEDAIQAAGGIPVITPTTTDRALLAEVVRRTDGVLLTGGDDINPGLYDKILPKRIRQTVRQTPDGGERDERELLLIREIFRQRKPLLAICRGHQILNVAFGGSLVADIRQQVPGALKHWGMDKAFHIAHEVTVTPGSLFAKICGKKIIGVNSTHHQAVMKPAKTIRCHGAQPRRAGGSDGIEAGVCGANAVSLERAISSGTVDAQTRPLPRHFREICRGLHQGEKEVKAARRKP